MCPSTRFWSPFFKISPEHKNTYSCNWCSKHRRSQITFFVQERRKLARVKKKTCKGKGGNAFVCFPGFSATYSPIMTQETFRRNGNTIIVSDSQTSPLPVFSWGRRGHLYRGYLPLAITRLGFRGWCCRRPCSCPRTLLKWTSSGQLL